MRPEAQSDVLQEVRQMLVRAKPGQTKRLLDDIARIQVNKAPRYDA
jgi:hypothetical protein